MVNNFEKYLANEPLNEELKALKEGRAADPGPLLVTGMLADANQSHAGENDPISRAEQVALKEWRGGPAWPVLQKVLKKATLAHQKSATLLSKDEPLANGQKIAEAWAYVKMLERVTAEITLLVESEIAKLEGEAN